MSKKFYKPQGKYTSSDGQVTYSVEVDGDYFSVIRYDHIFDERDEHSRKDTFMKADRTARRAALNWSSEKVKRHESIRPVAQPTKIIDSEAPVGYKRISWGEVLDKQDVWIQAGSDVIGPFKVIDESKRLLENIRASKKETHSNAQLLVKA